MKHSIKRRWILDSYTFALFAAVGLLLDSAALSVRATPVNWTGTTGNWGTATNWSLNLVPNNGVPTYEVTIGAASHDVSLDLSATVNSLSNAGTLRLLSGTTLTLALPAGFTNSGQLLIEHSGTSTLSGVLTNSGFGWVKSGTLAMTQGMTNNGTVWLGDGSVAGGTTSLRIQNSATWNGTGEVYFLSGAMTPANQPLIDIPAGVTLTNGANHRIHGGAGRIEGAGRLVNLGLIDADSSLRPLRIAVDSFDNQGNLWARSGYLNVAVNDWTNSGVIRISNGSQSSFTGSLFTNTTSGLIESIGNSRLDFGQAVINRGTISTAGTGRVNFGGPAGTLVTNLPGAVIDASAGNISFTATNGYVQNFGDIKAQQGVLEFRNGADLFGGRISLSQSGRLETRVGTSVFNQATATLDATSTLAAIDDGTGTVFTTFDGVLNNNGGLLLAESAGGNTATLTLSGLWNDVGGVVKADGGDVNVTNAALAESGTLHLELRRSGDVRFTGVDSTAANMTVDWTGNAGGLVFDNYQRSVGTTHLNLGSWTATGGALTIQNGSDLSASGLSQLPANTTVLLSGISTSLQWDTLATAPAGTLIDVAFGSRLAANHLTTDGEIRLRSGTFDGHLSLGSGAVFSAISSGNLITGAFDWVGNRTIAPTGGGAVLGFGGPVTVSAGSGLRLAENSQRFNGGGTITNSGLIEGGATNASNSVFLENDVQNTATGVIRAFQNGPLAITTYFQLFGNIANAGVIEANGATVYFNGADVTNSGTLRTVDHAAGSRLQFITGATVTNAGGTTQITGANSTLEVSGASVLNLGTLSFSGGADGMLSDANTAVSATNAVSVGAGSQLTLTNSSRFTAPGLTLGGTLVGQNSAVLDAPATVLTTGQILANSSVFTLNHNTTIAGTALTDGRLSLVNNSARVNGTGVITNNGLIEGGAPNTSNSVFLDNTVTNQSGGVIRAFQNGVATNTFFQLLGNITNAGVIEADGANIYFNGADVANSGTLRALDNAAISRLQFITGATVTNSGGSTQISGANSSLDVSGASVVDLGTLSFTNGADANISDANTMVTAGNSVTLGAGSQLTLTNSSRFNAPGVTLGGTLIGQNSATLNAPITVQTTGQILANSSIINLNGNVNILGTSLNDGRLSLVQNSSRVSGTGVITNNGLIEGGAPNTSNSVFVDNAINNQAGGVIRAFQNGAATNTFFQLFGAITNAGIIEADGGNIYFNGADVVNSGSLRTTNHAAGSRMYFIGGSTALNSGGTTQIDGANSSLEVSGASNLNLGTLSFTNGGDGIVSDSGTMVTATNTVPVPAGSQLTVANSSRFTAAGLTLGGTLIGQNSAVLQTPVTVQTSGQILANSGQFSLNNNVTIQGSGVSDGRLSLLNNSVRVNGTGIVTNNGLIEGGAPNTNNSVFLDNDLVNTADGTVRAFQNGTPTNTFFQLSGQITNDGLMEADASNLYFTTADVTNGGTIRTVADHSGQLFFLGGSKVTDAGGVIQLGAGTMGTVEGGGTIVDGAWSIAPTATLTLNSSAVLGGPSVQLAGTLNGRNTVTINAPMTVTPTGQLVADSGQLRLDGNVTLQGTGAAGGELRLTQSGANVVGDGVITSAGLIESVAPSNFASLSIANPIVNQSGGIIRATRINNAPNTTFFLTGNLVNQGTVEADASTLSLFNTFVDDAGGSWSALNGGRILVDGSFLGGASLSAATINGATSSLQLQSGALVEFAALNLVGGGDVLITGANSTLSLPTSLSVGAGSELMLVSGGRLVTPATTVTGTFTGAGGRLDGSLALSAPAVGTVTSGGTTIHGDVTVASGAQLAITGGGALVQDGTLTNAAGGLLRLNTNGVALSGVGTVVNSGLLEAGAFNNNNNTTLAKNLTNSGMVQALSIGGATSTNFHLSGIAVTNSGSMTATGADIVVNSSSMNHSGLLRAENGHEIVFQSTSSVANLGGGIQVDGATSRLQVNSSSNVNLQSLALVSGGDVSISSATLNVTTPFTVGTGSLLTMVAGTLSGAGMTVDGQMDTNTGTVQLSTTVSPTGIVNVTSSGNAQFNAALNVLGSGGNRGRVNLLGNSFRLGGTGTITNSGIIEAAAPNTNNSTFITSNIQNNADGVIRAAPRTSTTNTFLQLSGAITNNGIMEADGSQLYFTTGATLSNSGTLRAVNNAAASGLVFINGAQVSPGGPAPAMTLDGAMSALEISTGSDVAAGSLSFTSGATGFVTGSTSSLTTTTATLGTGSTFNVQSSALFTASGIVTNNGTLAVSGAGSFVANGNVVNGAASTLSGANGTTLDFNAALTVNNVLDTGNNIVDVDSDLTFGAGGRLRGVSPGRIRLAGDFSLASTQNTDFDSRDLVWELDRSLNVADPLLFEVGGLNVGPSSTGLTNNFGLGTMLISGADAFVRLTDLFNNPSDAAADVLYVNTLTISDLDSRLILNGLTLFYGTFNGNLAQIDTSLGGSFLQLTSQLAQVPEPGTWLVLLAGVGALGAGRRKRRQLVAQVR